MKKTSPGFTLIELLVVIAIIALLASIILASLNTARSKSRDARRVADLKEIQLALELYYNDNGKYPTSLSLLPTGNYISVVPTDPGSALGYAYDAIGSSASCTSYHLGAKLENNTQTAGSPLSQDVDYTDTANSECTSGTWAGNADIAATGGGFAGTDPVYDLRP